MEEWIKDGKVICPKCGSDNVVKSIYVCIDFDVFVDGNNDIVEDEPTSDLLDGYFERYFLFCKGCSHRTKDESC